MCYMEVTENSEELAYKQQRQRNVRRKKETSLTMTMGPDRRHLEPGPGRRRLEITAKDKGKVVFHRAGPSNIVLGLYKKFLETSDFPRHCPHCGQEIPTIMFTEHVQGCVRRHA